MTARARLPRHCGTSTVTPTRSFPCPHREIGSQLDGKRAGILSTPSTLGQITIV